MQIQLIRNATLRIRYNNHVILVDPFFAPKHSGESLKGISRNPMVDLPMSPKSIMDDVDLVIVSHLHLDHFDPIARRLLPKNLKIFCQPVDREKIAEDSFTDIVPLHNSITWNGITITPTVGNHGTGEWVKKMGSVMGFILESESEPTVYWVGDTVLIDEVEENIEIYKPQVIVTHSAGAEFEENSPIIMDAIQTVKVCESAPDAQVIAVHMDTLDHATITRNDLRAVANKSSISDTQLLIPQDGECITIT